MPVYRVLIDRIGGAEAEGWYDYLLRAFGGDPGLLDTDPDADLQPSTP